MKPHKIIIPIVLLALMITVTFANAVDKTTGEYQRVAERFVSILNEQWGVDQQRISGETYFLRDFGADSLDIMELVMALEEDFDIEILDEEWKGITTVNSAVEFIADKMDRRYR